MVRLAQPVALRLDSLDSPGRASDGIRHSTASGSMRVSADDVAAHHWTPDARPGVNVGSTRTHSALTAATSASTSDAVRPLDFRGR